jgi:hypothetical protein
MGNMPRIKMNLEVNKKRTRIIICSHIVLVFSPRRLEFMVQREKS